MHAEPLIELYCPPIGLKLLLASLTLLARNLFIPPPFMQELLAKVLPTFDEPFVLALARTLPGLPLEVLRMRDMFAGGVPLIVARQFGEMPMRNSPEFCEFLINEMVTFIAAGFRSESTISDSDVPSMAPHRT